MSGLQADGLFDLTATRARYWHRHRSECGCATLAAIAAEHLGDGFRWEFGNGGNFLRVQGDESALFEAIAGVGRRWPLEGGVSSS